MFNRNLMFWYRVPKNVKDDFTRRLDVELLKTKERKFKTVWWNKTGGCNHHQIKTTLMVDQLDRKDQSTAVHWQGSVAKKAHGTSRNSPV